jgi:hypothetical protein
MTPAETIAWARSRGVVIALNPAGDGLKLRSKEHAPPDVVAAAKGAKPELVAYLRKRHHAADDVPSANSPDHVPDPQRRLIVGRINDSFVSSPLDVCKHCGGSPKPDDPFVQMFVGDDSGAVHHGCWEAWQEAEDAKARLALGFSAAPAPEPEPDWGLAFNSLRKQLEGNVSQEEARLRARERTAREYQRLHNVGIDDAARAVDAIIAAKGNRP